MTRSRFFRLSVLAVLLAIVAAAALTAQARDRHYRGRKFKPPPPTSTVTITVVRKDDGKFIENASVIWHLVGEKGGMELHTDKRGKSMIDILPTGHKVILQILAHGYQTYGKVYTISKPNMAIKVALSRPVGQYTIYGHHDENVEGKSPIAVGHSDPTKPAAPSNDATKSSKDTKSSSAATAKQDQAEAKSQQN